jgi:sugar/nucleoside kinase (ribokinase family)
MPIETFRQKDVVTASRAVVDRTASFVPEKDLPQRIQQLPFDKFQTETPEEFREIEEELLDRGITFVSTVGGNSVNAAHRINALHRHQPDRGLVVVRTWVGSDGFRSLMEKDLKQPGMQPDIVEYQGNTPQGLIIPRETKKGRRDRTIISNQPEGLQSEFASIITENTGYAIVNSLGGKDWDKSLREGIKILQENNIPYAYTPGSPQFEAIETRADENKVDAVYEAIAGAKTLNVDISELKRLILGQDKDKKILPSTEITELLDQGLALGAENIFVTDGADGAYAASRDGKKIWVSAMPVAEEVSTVGAGDAHMAAAVDHFMRTGDLVESARRGSASGAFAVEHLGAHENPPSNEQIERRLEKDPPQVIPLSRAKVQEHELFVA